MRTNCCGTGYYYCYECDDSWIDDVINSEYTESQCFGCEQQIQPYDFDYYHDRLYGYYHCFVCTKKWESTHAYDGYKQACKSCYSDEEGYVWVYPYQTERLICSKCGEIYCICERIVKVRGCFYCEPCDNEWENTFELTYNGYVNLKQIGDDVEDICYDCDELVIAYDYKAKLENKRHTDPKKPHIQKLCQKCKDKRHPCSSNKNIYHD